MLPEKIVFAVDIGPECAERCGSSSSMNRLTAARQTIKRFIQLKRWMSPMHEFAIMTFAHTTFWHCEFGQSPDQLDKAVDEIHQADYETADYYDLLSLFEAVKEHVPDPSKPTFILRIVFLYFRSNTVPSLQDHKLIEFFTKNENCAFDSLYLHDRVSSENAIQAVFDFLNEVDEEKGRCYETRLQKRFNRYGLMLLANARQRQPWQLVDPVL